MMTHRELEREIEEVKTRAHLMQIERDAWIEAHREAMQIIAALRKALFPFAELPTVGWGDTVDLDVEFSQLITNREILDARDCWKSRIPEAA